MPKRNMAGWLLAFGAFACLARLWEGDLDMWDGIQHASIAWQILVTGDWVTMHSNGSPTFLKPPLYFWVTAVFFKLLGPTSLAARLLPALCGILAMVLTYAVARRALGERVALLSLLCLVSTALFLKYSRRGMLDVPVAAWTALGVYAVLRGFDDPRFFWLWGASLALGYLTKAIQGLYGLPIGLLTLMLARPRLLLSPHLVGGLLLAAGLAGPWILAETRLYGIHFTHSQDALGPFLDHPGGLRPAYLAPVKLLLKEDWPWIPPSLAGLGLQVAGFRFAAPAGKLLLIWPVVILLLLSMGPHLGHRYLVPMMPPLSIAAGVALSRWLGETGSARMLRWGGGGLAAIAAGFVLLPLPVIESPRTSELVPLARIAAADPTPGPLLAYRQDPPWEAMVVFSFYGRRHVVNASDAQTLGRLAAAAPTSVLVLTAATDVPALEAAFHRRFRLLATRAGQCLATLGPPGRAIAPASGNVIR